MNISRLYVPADVPSSMQTIFTENMYALTHETSNFFIFSCDHKIEHLNNDFFGEDIASEALYPEHLFTIASQAPVGAMAVPLGLLNRYGTLYPHINYIVKMSGTTHVTSDTKDPFSTLLWSIDDVIACRQAGLAIRGIAITIYVGSHYENEMLAQAAPIIRQAHAYGLVTLVYTYLHGKIAKSTYDLNVTAGICGLAHALGADVVKINYPEEHYAMSSLQQLRLATAAAGNTDVICSGGVPEDINTYIQKLYDQIQEGRTRGCAVGRTIFQKPLPEALATAHAIASLVYECKTPEHALKIYQQKLSDYHLQMQS